MGLLSFSICRKNISVIAFIRSKDCIDDDDVDGYGDGGGGVCVRACVRACVLSYDEKTV